MHQFSPYFVDNIKRYIPIYTKLHTLFKICKGECKDQDPMKSSLQSIEENINLLKTEVTGVPIQFVFNIDEVGQAAAYPVCRSIKQPSCIACI